LSAESELDRDLWIEALERVMERPLTPQDISGKVLLSSIIFFSPKVHVK